MQISDSTRGIQAAQGTGRPTDLKQDQAVQATIRQRVSSEEAIVEVNGQEYKARFERGLPQESNVSVRITGRNGDVLQLRTLSENGTKQNGTVDSNISTERIIREAGIKDTVELREMVSRLFNERVTVNKDTVRSLQQILQKGEGTIQQKQDIVSLMAQKKISITPKSYEAVFRTLHGPSLDKILNDLAKEAPELIPEQAIGKADTAGNVRANTKSATVNNLTDQLDVLKKALESNQSINKDALRKLINQIKQHPRCAEMSRETADSVLKVLQQIEKAISNVPEQDMTVPVEKLSQTIDLKKAQQILQQAIKELTGDVHSSPTKDKDLPNAAENKEAIHKLAELVVDLRLSGKITRNQLTNLQKAIENVIREAQLSPELEKDIQELVSRLAKDLRMSLSYEAVGKSTEAKAMVQRSLDTLIKMFKLPIAQVMASGNSLSSVASLVEDEGLQVLRPMSETFMKLGSLVALARQELIEALGNSTGNAADMQKWLAEPRDPKKIVTDFASSLREAAVRERLPKEEIRHMEQLLQRIETGFDDGGKRTDFLLDGMNELEQLLMHAGERLASLTAVQSGSFERVTQYIPEYLRKVGSEFNEIKKEVINNVERMTQFLQQKVPQSASYIQRIIEPTIEMVNRLVNKGEFALFADMEFEHSVLKISGDLQQVKGLLDKGKKDEALHLFQRIRTDLEKLNWQPSYMRVERFFSKATVGSELQNPFQTYGQAWREETLTGRGVQDLMRSMGLTHEREAMEWLARREGNAHAQGMRFADDTRQNQDAPPSNMKSLLLEGMDRNLSPRAREVMEQALSNLTGQQLLARQDSSASVHSMQVQLPLPWEEGMQSAELQVHARNNGQQMDWENCTLFFFLDTPRFGETGISVMVVNREMTLRIQNDDPKVEHAFQPYIPQMEQELQQLGYRINGVTFTPIGKEKQKEERELPTIDTEVARRQAVRRNGQEGMDFSV